MKKAKLFTIAATALMAVILGACSDINRQNGPVQLIVTITQSISTIDLQGGAVGCDIGLGTINLRSLLLQDPSNPNLPVDDRFNDIQLRSYRVTYVRTDGGHQVPEPFVRTISGTLSAGSTSSLLN